ncbi:MAG: amidase [Pseudomonadota bacterium]
MQNKIKPLLEIKNVSGGYDKIPVLHDISFFVNLGEIVGILGHNGMGKTTLLKHIMGFLPVSKGQITIHDEDITQYRAHQRSLCGIGYVPQGRGIFPNLTVQENLQFACAEISDPQIIATRTDFIVKKFSRLQTLLKRKGEYLSGGEKQILALARALMADPIMLLLDEPTEGIQPSINLEIIDILREQCHESNLSILLVEQNLNFLSNVSDRILVIEHGQVIDEMTTSKTNIDRLYHRQAGLSAAHTASLPSCAADKAQLMPSLPPDIEKNHHSSQQHLLSDPLVEPLNMAKKFQNGDCSMAIIHPQLQHMRNMAQNLGFSMSDHELSDYLNVMKPYLQAFEILDQTPDSIPKVKYPRTPGTRVASEDNPLNAWYVKTDIQGASNGPLLGRKIVLKDNVCLAGVPMMNGASILEGYTPVIDATVVTRLLDAGAHIIGKATCEYMCLSGGSHTPATGPVHNPYKMGYMAGGSSGGSAVLVSTGEADMAIACDQGGSIRIPSSNCGTYGMKATHGLVPYSGIIPIEQTIDHVGPITNNVYDNAMMLEVLAGADGLDPRQYNPKVERYSEAIGQGVSGLRIGLVKEGFARPESEPDVDTAVKEAASRLQKLGANVFEISLPFHLQAPNIWTVIALEGLQDLMMHGNALGTNYRGLFIPGLADALSKWRIRADELSKTLKLSMFLGEFFQTYHHGKFYGKAQNLSRKLRDEYIRAFTSCDLLLMPTLPMKAKPIPPADCPLDLYIHSAFEMIGNTCPFSVTGSPSMSIPCAMRDGLPVGMMLIGNDYCEKTIYRAAYAFEQDGDWRQW